jgi:hypothetical protein
MRGSKVQRFTVQRFSGWGEKKVPKVPKVTKMPKVPKIEKK